VRNTTVKEEQEFEDEGADYEKSISENYKQESDMKQDESHYS
jgi:hypothetical protein